jgi:hypothetical protein
MGNRLQLGCAALLLLLVTAPAFASSTITISGGNDLLFNNYLFTPATNVERVAAAIDDPLARAAGPQQAWSFDFDPDAKTTGIRTTDDGVQFDIVAPFAEIISLRPVAVALMPGRATIVGGGSGCGGAELSAVCTFTPLNGITTAPPHASLLLGSPYVPVQIVPLSVASLTTSTNMWLSWDSWDGGNDNWYGTDAPSLASLRWWPAASGCSVFAPGCADAINNRSYAISRFSANSHGSSIHCCARVKPAARAMVRTCSG